MVTSLMFANATCRRVYESLSRRKTSFYPLLVVLAQAWGRPAQVAEVKAALLMKELQQPSFIGL